MDHQPQEPRDEARELHSVRSAPPPCGARSSPSSPCRGSGTAGAACPRCGAAMFFAACRPLWIASWRDARQRLAVLRLRDQIADHEHLGVTGHAEIGLHTARARRDRAARRGARVSGRRARRRPTARCARRCARRPIATKPSPTIATPGVPVRTSTPSSSSWRRARSRQVFGERRQHARARPRAGPRASCADRCAGSRARACGRAISASAPASSTPVGPAADDHERRPARAAARRSRSRSAASNASRMRRRISSASSIVLSPGACAAHSSWPKYECVCPVATIR